MSDSSALLVLPPELRNHIYDIVRADQTDYTTIRITNGSFVLHPLTRTCRQFRQESSSVLQPDKLDNTSWVIAQVLDFKFDALNKALSSFPILNNRTVLSLTTLLLTAPGDEHMNQLHSWLTARRAEALHPLASPGRGFDHFDRFYSTQIDWNTHSLPSASRIVDVLTSMKLGKVTKGSDASGIHCVVATAVKRRQNELLGIKPGRSMLGIMGGPRKAVKASHDVCDGRTWKRPKDAEESRSKMAMKLGGKGMRNVKKTGRGRGR